MLTNYRIYTCEIKSRIAMAKHAINKKRAIFTSTLDIKLRKRLVKRYSWSIVFYGAETWTLRRKKWKNKKVEYIGNIFLCNFFLTYVNGYNRRHFRRVQPKRCDVSQFIYFCKTLYIFRPFFRPSSGAQNCTYSARYLSDQHCYLLLARPG